MTRLTITGHLTAADDRTLKGLLLPFGSPGYTNLGRVTVPDATHITVPADVSALFASLDHLDARDTVAEFTTIEARPEGLWAEWSVPLTHGGDRLLAEYRAGVRTGISVELEPVTVTDGIATGTLIGCAFPTTPAFADARLVAELAPDMAPDPAAAAVEETATTMAEALGLVWADLDDTARAPFLQASALLQDSGVTVAPPDPPALTASTPQTPDAAGVEDPHPTEDDTMTTATAPAALLAGSSTTPTPCGPDPHPPAGRRRRRTRRVPPLRRRTDRLLRPGPPHGRPHRHRSRRHPRPGHPAVAR